MRTDYILIGSLSIIGLGLWLLIKYITFNAVRCCGDCELYEKCWKKYDVDCYETPACSGFKERYNDFNRD